MAWTNFNEIGDRFGADDFNAVYGNLQYIATALTAKGVTVPSLVQPELSAGRNTVIYQILPNCNMIESDITILQGVSTGWNNPYYIESVTWTRITPARRDKVLRWIKWLNYCKEALDSGHDQFDYLKDIHSATIYDIHGEPIMCFT